VILVEDQQNGDNEREQAEKFGGREADEQAALLAISGTRIAQRAFEERGEHIAHAERGKASANRRETGTEESCCRSVHDIKLLEKNLIVGEGIEESVFALSEGFPRR
jgi:hypothetical protein